MNQPQSLPLFRGDRCLGLPREEAELSVENCLQVEGNCTVLRAYCIKEPLWKGLIFVIGSFFTLGLLWLLAHWSEALKRKLQFSYCRLDEATHLRVLNWDKSWSIHPIQHLWRKGRYQAIIINRYLCYELREAERSLRPFQYSPGADLRQGAVGLSSQQAVGRKRVYGQNRIHVQKSVGQIFLNEVLNPFYFIELFCVVVWIAEDYTYYAVLILAAFLFSTLYNVFLVLNNFNFLSEMAGDSSLQVQILRDGQYQSHLSEELVPGDVFRLEQTVPCDCLLLEGAVVVDEREVSGDNFASKMHYDPAINPRNYTIYKGSRVISSNAAVAIASATAFSTLKGQLLRASLFPISYNFKFYREPLQFIGVLACLVVIVFFCVSSPLLKYLPGTDFALLLLDLMTLIIQPSLPLALTVGVGLSLEELQNQGILCLAPPKIVAGGNLDTIVVDSTQFISNEDVSLSGFVEIHPGQPLELTAEANTFPLNFCMGCCHSLVRQGEQLQGDVRQRILFAASKNASFQAQLCEKRLNFLRVRAPFDRRTVNVIRCRWSQLLALRLQDLDLLQCMVQSYVSKGFESQIFAWDQDGSLKVVGMALFSYSVSKCAKEFAAWTKESKIPTLLVSSGDVHTASHILSKARLVDLEEPIALCSYGGQGGYIRLEEYQIQSIMYQDIALVRAKAVTLEAPDQTELVKKLLAVLENYDRIAINGPLFALLSQTQSEFIHKCVAVAEVNEAEKAGVIAAVKELGRNVLFITNREEDAIGLRQADIGLLLNKAGGKAGTSQYQFSSSRGLFAGEALLRWCRVALQNNFQTFKLTIVFAAIQGTSNLIMYSCGAELNNGQSLFEDLVLTGPIFITLLAGKPAQKLAKCKPEASLFSFHNMLSLLILSAVAIVSQLIALSTLESQDFYKGTSANFAVLSKTSALTDTSIEGQTIFCFSNFLYVFVSVACLLGQRHKQPLWTTPALLANIVLVYGLCLYIPLVGWGLPESLALDEERQDWFWRLVAQAHFWGVLVIAFEVGQNRLLCKLLV